MKKMNVNCMYRIFQGNRQFNGTYINYEFGNATDKNYAIYEENNCKVYVSVSFRIIN